MPTLNIVPEKINGKEYYNVRQFAQITNKSEKTIYALISKGNSIRKLRCEYFFGRPVIPAEEFTDFIFTGPGRFPGKDLYQYDLDGNQVPLKPLLGDENEDCM